VTNAAGNYRTLTTIAAHLLIVAAERNLSQLDEKLYFEVFNPDTRKSARRAGARTRSCRLFERRSLLPSTQTSSRG
jgi:general secretion pathway protein A